VAIGFVLAIKFASHAPFYQRGISLSDGAPAKPFQGYQPNSPTIGTVPVEAHRPVEQTLAASADLNLGRAAFAEAVRQRPAQRIVLRHKSRVIEEYKQ
jgi:hypothetical protein